jgi:DNA adenine methylase
MRSASNVATCDHPHGIPGVESAYCPACRQTFLPRSRDYIQINKRQLTLPLEPSRPAFRYFGGKWEIGEWIASHFPSHQVYVEPYGGAFSVGMQKSPAATEVYNDLNADTCNFFEELQLNTEALISAIAASPRTKEEYQLCKQPTDDLLEWARRYYLYCQLSYPGGGGRWSGGTSQERLSRRSGDEHLWAIAQRMKSVHVYCSDALKVIGRFDSPDTLFYCDPPYVHQSRGSKDSRHKDQFAAQPRRQYRYEMTDQQHCELAELLQTIQGQAIVSGYDCPLYQELYSGWTRFEREVPTSTRQKKTECLWVKPERVSVAVHQKLSGKQSVGQVSYEQEIAQLEAEIKRLRILSAVREAAPQEIQETAKWKIGDRCQVGFSAYAGMVWQIEKVDHKKVEVSSDLGSRVFPITVLLPLEQVPEVCVLPLEPININWAEISHDQLAQLERERDRLAEVAANAPETGWIETGIIKGKKFRQSWWRGVERDGKKTTIYLGKVESPEYKKARAAQQARRSLKRVNKQIALVKKQLGDV